MEKQQITVKEAMEASKSVWYLLLTNGEEESSLEVKSEINRILEDYYEEEEEEEEFYEY